MRCGSTSIHNLLSQHPDIFMSKVKEPLYYKAEQLRRLLNESSDKSVKEELQQYISYGKHRERHSYDSLFIKFKNEKYIGESSHYLYRPETAQVIHADCPSAKILVCLRNPIDRIYSEYLFSMRNGKIDQTFDDYVNYIQLDPSRSRLNLGFYSKGIKIWKKYFNERQMKIILFEEFFKSPIIESQEIFEWLDINPQIKISNVHAEKSGVPQNRMLFNSISNSPIKKIAKPFFSKIMRIKLRALFYNKSLNREEINPILRSKLFEIYRDEIDNLEKEIGQDLSHWK